MLFHVEMTVSIPRDIDPEIAEEVASVKVV